MLDRYLSDRLVHQPERNLQKSGDGSSEGDYFLSKERLASMLEPLFLACHTKQAKLVEPAITCLTALITRGILKTRDTEEVCKRYLNHCRRYLKHTYRYFKRCRRYLKLCHCYLKIVASLLKTLPSLLKANHPARSRSRSSQEFDSRC